MAGSRGGLLRWVDFRGSALGGLSLSELNRIEWALEITALGFSFHLRERKYVDSPVDEQLQYPARYFQTKCR